MPNPTSEEEEYGQDTVSLATVTYRSRARREPGHHELSHCDIHKQGSKEPCPWPKATEAGQEQKWIAGQSQQEALVQDLKLEKAGQGDQEGKEWLKRCLPVSEPPVYCFCSHTVGLGGPAIPDNRGPVAPVWTPPTPTPRGTRCPSEHTSLHRSQCLSTHRLNSSSSFLPNREKPARCYQAKECQKGILLFLGDLVFKEIPDTQNQGAVRIIQESS